MSLFTFITLIITCIIINIGLVFSLNNKGKSQLKTLSSLIFILLLIWIISLILQSTFAKTLNINPIKFDYFTYIGVCFLPVIFLLFSIAFSKTKFKFTKKYLLLFIIPVLSLILLWTNNAHHLFYKVYSTNLNENVYGNLFYIHAIYTFVLYLITFYILIKYSVKNSGLFSKQALLIIIGCIISVTVNLLGFFTIVPMSIYVTPVTFALTSIFITLAISKFDFLKVAPIALQRIVDRMSDGYIIVNGDNYITDFNKTFLDLFSLKPSGVRNVYIGDLLDRLSNSKNKNEDFLNLISSTKNNNNTVNIERHFTQIKKYFNIEINSIRNKNSYLGTLILFKDITQHKEDVKTIKDNQDILVERERLATLGQMIGGIAHNLKTPIMSISGATEGILDLINEYRSSIGDPEVTVSDHKEIANDMEEWIKKIQTHLSYMSDVITTVKGQAVAFSDNTTFTSFTIDDFIRQVNILMKHELSHSLVELEETLEVPLNTVVKGNVNSLVQVANNIISNAIQAYNGTPNQKVVLNIYSKDNLLVIKVQDFAGGIPDSVKSKLFKEMTTTKGKNGTGLGLFMSYSNIRAHFNGNIRFETRKGKGTSFYIEIPN